MGVDLACRTEGVGEICVQVKSSDHYAKKFLAAYRAGKRGAVPIAVIAVRDAESNLALGDRIVAAVGALRDEIVAVGRNAWIVRMEREFVLRRALEFRTADLDVEAACAFMDLAEQLPEPWPLWLQAIHHGGLDKFDHPAGVVCLDTAVGFQICVFPSRCPERIERLRQAIGSERPASLVLFPLLLPENADVAWLDAKISSRIGQKYQKLACFAVPSVRRCP